MVFPTLNEEVDLWKKGYKLVCGIDEVGRGCFAGPVVVGAVIFPAECKIIEGVTDSKLLSSQQREKLDTKIKKSAICWAIAEVDVPTINKIGIGKATQIAFRKVVKLLTITPDFILIDAFYIKQFKKEKQKAIFGGDQKSLSIAAASIIAKVYRDKLMQDLHIKYPNYGFAKHKGYGTKEHQKAIAKHGLSKIHRKSFSLEKFLITA